jgi:uncharacterized protein
MWETKIHFLVPTLLSIIFFPVMSCYADFHFAVAQYEKGNFEQAYKEFEQAAQFGDHDAQYNLAAMYYRGEYVEKNQIKSYAWFALAAQDKNYHEENIHQKIYQKFSPTDKRTADQLYKKYFSRYSEEAVQQSLVPVYNNTAKPSDDLRITKTINVRFPNEILQDISGGWVDILFTVEKNGTTRDHVVYFTPSKAMASAAIRAVRAWQYEPREVDNRPVTTNGVKARFYFQRVGHTIDDAKTTAELREMQQKAAEGTADDQLKVAYFLGAFPPQQKHRDILENPNQWYVKAAINGNSTASFFLAQNLLTGSMCDKDTYKAMGWLLKAASGNVTEAQYFLAMELLNGLNFEKNEEKALYWMERSANSNPAAQLRFAWILATHPNETIRNLPVAKNYLAKVARTYHDKQSLYQVSAAVAAEQGDFKRAITWQRKALNDAQELELPLNQLNARLAAYNNKQPWREAL